mmetsp:Transcript_4044/g.11717  ORF Transcript_4044/g.11717 Transcript_4044/m.11717 type:complete len:253 (+) Transcript_4044:279-1037(+)|eukprot:CAMPEP_0206141352 /NCGR_PEP_ID=MMETSP1473-20131121/12640_1 /ASSEMBLY_ACC=CAM_ASM_001109 /TAXON_ID=1461547 /ORGANISM="Stichococcus sp, Strain RCC1054" /LENGTH=252 /DNA_ID=CAMNT_0053535883 /DNA_START=214 /DNA_END=972 /DNA_ORIENTATION=+
MRNTLARAFQQTAGRMMGSTRRVTMEVPEHALSVHPFQEKSYQEGLDLQDECWKWRQEPDSMDSLLFLQHPHMYTFGKRGEDKHLLKSREELKGMGIALHESPRGGELTYHGPGQLVVYPIVSLRKLGIGPREYVERLEDVIIDTAKACGVEARGRINCRTGVWVEDRKLAAIGVRIARGVTTHGVAINVNTDLSYFDHIVACGIKDAKATSLHLERGNREFLEVDPMKEVSAIFGRVFGEHFGYRTIITRD